MKKIFFLLPFFLVCSVVMGAGAFDTVGVPADTVVDARRQQRQERKEDRKEANKNAQEHLKDEARDAAEDVKREAVETYNEVKENLKENFRQAKESLTSWFNENIAANTVGDFAQMQRQNNQNFSDYLRSPWTVCPLSVHGAQPMIEGSFFTPRTTRLGNADTSNARTIAVEAIIEPLERMAAPMPENYFSGAGGEAVSDLLSKQQFADFKFYGQAVRIYYMPTLRNISIGKGLENGVSRFWQYMAAQDFNPVLFQLYQYKENLSLNDYQYYLLLRQFSDLLFAKGKKGENLLFTVFLLNHTGYDARIAQYQGDGDAALAILLPFFEEVSNQAYIMIGQNRYYLMDIEPGKKIAQSSVKVYEKAHANATHPLSLRIMPQDSRMPPLYGKFQGYTFDERLAQMQSELPAGPLALCAQTEFSSLMSKTFQYKLLPELDSLVRKKQDANLMEQLSERDQQEIKILNLNAFLNRSLSSQAKQSAKMTARPLYPEVMFLKKGSGDILDRSILLCQISNRILGIPAVLLVYPNFAMAAVCFAQGKENPQSPFYQGTYVDIDGKRYFLCGQLPKAVKNPGQAKVYKW